MPTDFSSNADKALEFAVLIARQYKNTSIKSVHLKGHRFQETIEEYIREQRIDIVAILTRKRTCLESIFNRK